MATGKTELGFSLKIPVTGASMPRSVEITIMDGQPVMKVTGQSGMFETTLLSQTALQKIVDGTQAVIKATNT